MAGRGAALGARQRGNSGPRAHLRATANLPVELDAKLRRASEATGLTLSAYICQLVARDVRDVRDDSDAQAAA
jgi:hypothetical protein